MLASCAFAESFRSPFEYMALKGVIRPYWEVLLLPLLLAAAVAVLTL